MNLSDIEKLKWNDFEISEVFDEVRSSKSQIDKIKLKNKIGVVPYITRTDRNNGIDSFIGEQPDFEKDPANSITIGLDTQTVFYQATSFYTGQNIQVIRDAKLTQNIALFLIPILKKQLEKFSWGSNGATLTRLRRTKMALPINEKGDIFWEFMDGFINSLTESIKESFPVTETNNIYDYRKLEEVEWSGFKIGELFHLHSGKSKGLNHYKEGGIIPYVGATNRNNGVLTFVYEKENTISKGKSIAFIRNGEGSMGYSIYKEEDFIATSDVSVGYNKYLNRYTGTFITTIADKVRGKYNFGYKRSAARLKSEILQLPIKEDGNPDWAFMEQYMIRIENELMK
jgi:hypothetical protein